MAGRHPETYAFGQSRVRFNRLGAQYRRLFTIHTVWKWATRNAARNCIPVVANRRRRARRRSKGDRRLNSLGSRLPQSISLLVNAAISFGCVWFFGRIICIIPRMLRCPRLETVRANRSDVPRGSFRGMVFYCVVALKESWYVDVRPIFTCYYLV